MKKIHKILIATTFVLLFGVLACGLASLPKAAAPECGPKPVEAVPSAIDDSLNWVEVGETYHGCNTKVHIGSWSNMDYELFDVKGVIRPGDMVTVIYDDGTTKVFKRVAYSIFMVVGEITADVPQCPISQVISIEENDARVWTSVGDESDYYLCGVSITPGQLSDLMYHLNGYNRTKPREILEFSLSDGSKRILTSQIGNLMMATP